MADNDGGGILWFLAGLGIGAALGILMRRRPGRKLASRFATLPSRAETP